MDQTNLSKIAEPLLRWYASCARVLPWRDLPSPYRVWISEIMLQQTRVETVLPYFERFTEALPTIEALAQADEQQLLKLWEGLGYYSRVRNMKKAACMIMQSNKNELPCSFDELIKLPGIGAYSAGAIASIAFGERVPAVDGNVLRVIARITASREDVSDGAVKKRIEQSVREILPEKDIGAFNQSLMELGAMVCLPNGAPKCDICPLHNVCAGSAQGIAEQLPIKAAKKPRKLEQKTVFVILYGNRLAIQKRDGNGLLAGMWELPNVNGTLTKEQGTEVLEGWGISFEDLKILPKAKHIFTHIEWQMTGYMVRVIHMEMGVGFVWVSPDELKEHYALPSAFKAYLKNYIDTNS